ncbi:MAG: MFS transporter [Chloroflexi bacterium]|nr:MFS transporter [Chloroflexota bacterium]
MVSSRGQRVAALHYRDFTLYWLSQISSNIGSWMQQVATGWLVLQLTNSPAYLGLNALLQGLPLIIFALVGGVIADRFDRFRLMVGSQIAYMVPDAALAWLVTTGTVRVEHVFAYSLITAAISGLTNPARQSLVPSLVPRSALLSALALNSMVWQGSAVIGPSLAGLALAYWGLPASFNINVLSDVVSLATILLVHAPPRNADRAVTSGWREVQEGLSYAWHDRKVRILLLSLSIMAFLARPYTQLMPVFARDVFQVGPQGLGLMLTMPAVGTITAAFVLAAVGRIPLIRAYLLTATTLALALIGFTITRNFPLALALLVVIGGCTSGAATVINTPIQEVVTERLRGRVMSLFMAGNQGAWRLGATPAGFLADLWSAPVAIALGAVVLLGVLASLARGRTLWEAETSREELSLPTSAT